MDDEAVLFTQDLARLVVHTLMSIGTRIRWARDYAVVNVYAYGGSKEAGTLHARQAVGVSEPQGTQPLT